jgi:hypothetical protein
MLEAIKGRRCPEERIIEQELKLGNRLADQVNSGMVFGSIGEEFVQIRKNPAGILPGHWFSYSVFA